MENITKKIKEGRVFVAFFIIVISLAIVTIMVFPLQEKQYYSIISGSFLILLASMVFGLLLGFLFGVPKAKPKKNNDEREQSNNSSNEKTGTNYDPNTNLEDISDWLTKIIVGVGLTQMASIDPAISRLSLYLAGSINLSIGNSGFVYALLLYGSISGFIFGYVLTRIYLPYLFFRLSDLMAINQLKDEVIKLNEKLGENDIIAKMYAALYEVNGYDIAIKEATDYLNEGVEPLNVHFWIYLCCAYAQKYDDNPNDIDLRNEALKAANKAIEKEKGLALSTLRYLWDPTLHGDSEENDLEVFYNKNDDDFKILLSKV